MNIVKITTSLFLGLVLLTLNSCKKDEDDTPVVPAITSTSEMGSNDETARNEYDNAVDDIFSALENTGLSTGRTSSNGVILPCGVVKIDSSGGSYKFVYDSTTNCSTRILSGSISAALISGTTWADSNAKMTLTFSNYKIFYSVNNQTLTFNGALTVTNVNGGKLWNVLTTGGKKTIVHTIAGVLNITFDNNVNDTRIWTISKKRTYWSTDGKASGVRWSLEADGINAEVGTAKDGSPFITTIPTPITWINCSATGSFEGPFIATTGELRYTNNANYMLAEAGYKYDSSTKKETKVNDCSSEGYKLTFFINGITQTSFQYY